MSFRGIGTVIPGKWSDQAQRFHALRKADSTEVFCDVKAATPIARQPMAKPRPRVVCCAAFVAGPYWARDDLRTGAGNLDALGAASH